MKELHQVGAARCLYIYNFVYKVCVVVVFVVVVVAVVVVVVAAVVDVVVVARTCRYVTHNALRFVRDRRVSPCIYLYIGIYIYIVYI